MDELGLDLLLDKSLVLVKFYFYINLKLHYRKNYVIPECNSRVILIDIIRNIAKPLADNSNRNEKPENLTTFPLNL